MGSAVEATVISVPGSAAFNQLQMTSGGDGDRSTINLRGARIAGQIQFFNSVLNNRMDVVLAAQGLRGGEGMHLIDSQ